MSAEDRRELGREDEAANRDHHLEFDDLVGLSMQTDFADRSSVRTDRAKLPFVRRRGRALPSSALVPALSC